MQVALMQQIVGDPAGPAAMALPEALLAQLAGSSPASFHLLRELRQLAAARQAGGLGALPPLLQWIPVAPGHLRTSPLCACSPQPQVHLDLPGGAQVSSSCSLE
jgi:hypothetical protein